MVWSVPTKIGLTNPNSRMLAAICWICELEWGRAFVGVRLQLGHRALFDVPDD
jgi:hypothetical protein